MSNATANANAAAVAGAAGAGAGAATSAASAGRSPPHGDGAPRRSAGPNPPSARRAAIAWALAGGLGLSACGGGVSIGIGFGESVDRSPPSVSLTASATTVAPGQAFRLVAAAADESGIESVAFVQLDSGQERSLGVLGSPPYELTVSAPTDGRTALGFYARATDRFGNRTNSNIVSVAVQR